MTRLLRAAGAISAFTLCSRILGLVRDRLMTTTLGASWVSGTFLLAWTFPNLMRRLLGEGALSASFMPAYAAERRRDPQAARALLAEVTGTVITVLAPLCLVIALGCAFAPAAWFPAPKEGGPAATALLLRLEAVLFLYALPVCLTAIYSGALNQLSVFALPAAVPIVLNAAWIAAVLLVPVLGVATDEGIATAIAWALLLGGTGQLLLVVVPLWRRGELRAPKLGLPKRGTAAWAVFAAMGPTVIGMSLNQLSSLLDQVFAYVFVGEGAVMYVYLANRLLLFPHALTALSVAVAVFPRFTAQATAADREGLRRTLDLAAGATLLVTIPAAAGLIVLCEDVVGVLFAGDRFGPQDVSPTVATCSLLVAGLPAIGLAQLYARAFYAVGDPGTPARLAGWLVLGNAALNVVLLLTTSLGTAGLALASSLSACANAFLLARAFRRHAAPRPGLAAALARSAIATAGMCAVLPFTRLAGEDAGWAARAAGDVAVPIAAGVAVYLVLHVLLRSPELAALRRRRASVTPPG